MARKLIGVVLVVVNLLACSGNAPTTYHSLATTPNHVQVDEVTSRRIKSLGVGPVHLPTLLDREGMVMRKNATTLSVSDNHLWGGQLEDEFLGALNRQLQARLPMTRVQTVPWEVSQTPQYQVTVKIDQFDGGSEGRVVLAAQWQLQRGSDARIIKTRYETLTRQAQDKKVESLVAAQSLLVGDFAESIIHGLVE